MSKVYLQIEDKTYKIDKPVLDKINDMCKEIERLNNIIKEAIRILNSARKHYDSEETNWAIERALKVLKNE